MPMTHAQRQKRYRDRKREKKSFMIRIIDRGRLRTDDPDPFYHNTMYTHFITNKELLCTYCFLDRIEIGEEAIELCYEGIDVPCYAHASCFWLVLKNRILSTTELKCEVCGQPIKTNSLVMEVEVIKTGHRYYYDEKCFKERYLKWSWGNGEMDYEDSEVDDT